MTYPASNHALTSRESDELARALGIAPATMAATLERTGMLRDPDGIALGDELRVLASLLEDFGTVNQGGDSIEDESSRLCYVAGRLLARLYPDVMDLCVAAGVDLDSMTGYGRA